MAKTKEAQVEKKESGKKKEIEQELKEAPIEILKFKVEKKGSYTLVDAVTDSEGVKVNAGTKVKLSKKSEASIPDDVEEGAVYGCDLEAGIWRPGKKYLFVRGDIKILEGKEAEAKPSIYEVLTRAPKPDDFTVTDKTWRLLLRNILTSTHSVLIGPTGSGKTELIKHAAEVLGYNLEYFNLGNSEDPRAKLLGTTHLVKDSDNGDVNVTSFIPSRFVQAIQSEKTIVMLDEINRSNFEVNNILLTLLDNQGYLELDECSHQKVVKKVESCVLIGTANIGDEYVGTKILDRAFKDRTMLINIDYLSEADEQGILTSRTGIAADDAKSISSFAAHCRSMWRQGQLTTPVSTRMTLESAALVRDGFSVSEAIDAAVVPYYDDDGTAESECTKVKQVIQSKIGVV